MSFRSMWKISVTTALLSIACAGCAGSIETFPGTDIKFHTGGGDYSGSASCDLYASSLAKLVEVSDKVIIATVVSAEPDFATAYGTETPDEGKELEVGAYMSRNLGLKVEKVISDHRQRDLSQVNVWGWSLGEDRAWEPTEINDNERLNVGDRAIFPLTVPIGDINTSYSHGMLCTGAFLLDNGKVVTKKPATPRLLEFSEEGPDKISAYQMSEEQLAETLADLAEKQGTLAGG